MLGSAVLDVSRVYVNSGVSAGLANARINNSGLLAEAFVIHRRCQYNRLKKFKHCIHRDKKLVRDWPLKA